MGTYFLCPVSIREHECSSCRKHYDPINMFIIHKKIIIPTPKDGAICFWKSSAEFSCRFRMERSSRFEYQQHHLLCCHHHHHQQSSMLCSLLFLMEHTTVGWGGGEWGGAIIYIIPITKDTWTVNINHLETKGMGKTKLSLTEQGLFSIKLKSGLIFANHCKQVFKALVVT